MTLREAFRTYSGYETPVTFRQSENAQWLLRQRYTAEGETSLYDVACRVARVVASAESLYTDDAERIRQLECNIRADMADGRFLFNSPCLYGAGAGLNGCSLLTKSTAGMTTDDYKALYEATRTPAQQLFACFVTGVPDSIEGIFNAARDAAVISKFGGGVGMNFSHLRESGAPIKGGVGGTASGPVSFMKVWNTTGEVVVQGGRRRAALMGMLDVDHPDIEKFITCKTKEGELPYFNISVSVSDAFMRAVADDRDWALISRADGSTVRTVRARELWRKICGNAWLRGDPGVFFRDTANRDSLLAGHEGYAFEATNPCGEQPLPNYTSCNLGSVNLSAFNGRGEREAFRAQIMRAVYYLDLVIDATNYPLDLIAERTRAIRPVGVGIMGLADQAIRKNLRYGSDAFSEWCGEVAQDMAAGSLTASAAIVEEFGKSAYSEARRLDDCELPVSVLSALKGAPELEKAVREGRLRNSRRLSIAPTGSISMLLDASSGIEPNFAWSWTRNVMRTDGEGYDTRTFLHPLVTSLDEIRGNPVYVTAHDVTPEEHVAVTAQFAPYIDSGISKTVNLPNEATVDDVKKVYELCYSQGVKGITVYRDGSRDCQPLHADGHTETVKERPVIVEGRTTKDTTPWGKLWVTMNRDEKNKPFEVFVTLGKSGSELKAMTEALSRVISIGLRSGGRIDDFIATLRGISGREAWMFDHDDETVLRSIPDAVAALMQRLTDAQPSEKPESGEHVCPECGSPMELVGGCMYCYSCGYSPCK